MNRDAMASFLLSRLVFWPLLGTDEVVDPGS